MKALKLVAATFGQACSFTHYDPLPINAFMGPTPEICSIKYRRHFHTIEMPIRGAYAMPRERWEERNDPRLYAEICLEEGILYYVWLGPAPSKQARFRLMLYVGRLLRQHYGKDWRLDRVERRHLQQVGIRGRS